VEVSMATMVKLTIKINPVAFLGIGVYFNGENI
jgi:hypothetical protein